MLMRTEGDFIKINKWLLPLSWLYGMGVAIRNELFEMGLLKSRAFNIPVISVGNITVGGSGKTPHVEYLIRLLQDSFKVAVLSRGYKRKSKGYQLASKTSKMSDLGDEPYQMKQKFSNIYVAVDRDRCNGIERLTTDQATNDVEVILLDDAYQHRYVKPGINILLVDYHRLIIYDKLLPAGRLREPISGKTRANMVIITKCPRDLKPMEFRVLTKALNLYTFQHLFFTTITYENLQPLFAKRSKTLNSINKNDNILLLTGIASPKQMLVDLAPYSKNITSMNFPDHHFFTPKDVEAINKRFSELPEPKLLITTEKDATRLKSIEGLSKEVRKALYVLPIRIRFLLGKEKMFNDKILSYVQKNSRNSILAQREDDHQP